MKTLHFTSVSLSLACMLSLTAQPRALGETAPAGNAKALLDDAKKNQTERKRAALQTELDRLGEDAKKAKQEMDDVEKSISKVGNVMNETKSLLDQLAGRRTHISQDLEVMHLRIEAERLRSEGLALLNSAHGKAMDALVKRNEELDLRKALVSGDMQKASGSEAVSESDAKKGKNGSSPSLGDLRRNLAKAEVRSSLANSRAREAMDAASVKLQQADAATAKAEKRQAEFAAGNNPGAPSANEQPKAKAKKAH